MVQIFQVDKLQALNSSGQQVKIINKGATFDTNPFSDTVNTTKVGSAADLASAYPVNTNITNTARVLNLKSILPGQSVVYTQNISIQGATPFYCDESGNRPVLRNTMILSDPNQVANGSNLAFTDSNIVTVVGQSGLSNKNLNFSASGPFITDINHTDETNSANDGTSVNSAKIIGCLPDIDVKKTVDIGLGQLKSNTSSLVYTIKVKNIGNLIAKQVRLLDTLPNDSTTTGCIKFNSKISGPDGVVSTDQKNIDYALGDVTPNQEITIVFKADIGTATQCRTDKYTLFCDYLEH